MPINIKELFNLRMKHRISMVDLSLKTRISQRRLYDIEMRDDTPDDQELGELEKFFAKYK